MCNGHICGIRDKNVHLFHSKLALLKYHARFLTWIKHIEKLITTLETLITRKSKNVCTLSNQINRFQWLNQYRVSSWKSKVFFSLCLLWGFSLFFFLFLFPFQFCCKFQSFNFFFTFIRIDIQLAFKLNSENMKQKQCENPLTVEDVWFLSFVTMMQFIKNLLCWINLSYVIVIWCFFFSVNNMFILCCLQIRARFQLSITGICFLYYVLFFVFVAAISMLIPFKATM